MMSDVVVGLETDSTEDVVFKTGHLKGRRRLLTDCTGGIPGSWQELSCAPMATSSLGWKECAAGN